MLDCLSNGRLISGFARGIPREYQVHNVPLARVARPLRGGLRDHHPRLDRGGVLLRRASSGRTRTWRSGRARCSSRIRRSGCRSSAARNRSSSPAGTTCRSRRASAARAGCATTSSATTPSASPRPATAITPDHLSLGINAYVADCKAQAVQRDAGPITSTSTARCSATATSPRPSVQRAGRLRRAPPRPTTCGRRTSAPRALLREDFRNMTMADVERQAEHMPWGTADEVAERIIDAGRAAPAPTRCRSASIAAPCRTRCSWSRSAASPARCCRRCRRTRSTRVPLAEEAAA